jgi:hypothetical protein
VRRALAALAALGLGGALAAWGCASASTAAAPAGGNAARPAQAAAEHDWQHYEPDGGWATYKPAPRPFDYEVDPARAVVGEPTTSPFGLAGSDVH